MKVTENYSAGVNPVHTTDRSGIEGADCGCSKACRSRGRIHLENRLARIQELDTATSKRHGCEGAERTGLMFECRSALQVYTPAVSEQKRGCT